MIYIIDNLTWVHCKSGLRIFMSSINYLRYSDCIDVYVVQRSGPRFLIKKVHLAQFPPLSCILDVYGTGTGPCRHRVCIRLWETINKTFLIIIINKRLQTFFSCLFSLFFIWFMIVLVLFITPSFFFPYQLPSNFNGWFVNHSVITNWFFFFHFEFHLIHIFLFFNLNNKNR